MSSFYEWEIPAWPVKEDVVLRRHRIKLATRYELALTSVRQKSPVSEAESGLGRGHTATKHLELEVAALMFTLTTEVLYLNPEGARRKCTLFPTVQMDSSLFHSILTLLQGGCIFVNDECLKYAHGMLCNHTANIQANIFYVYIYFCLHSNP